LGPLDELWRDSALFMNDPLRGRRLAAAELRQATVVQTSSMAASNPRRPEAGISLATDCSIVAHSSLW
jgi:hypothetical protein